MPTFPSGSRPGEIKNYDPTGPRKLLLRKIGNQAFDWKNEDGRLDTRANSGVH